jgi:hypothetical protein
MVQRAKRVAIAVGVVIVGAAAFWELPTPWNRSVLGLTVFATMPILTWTSFSTGWQRRALLLGGAGVFVAGLMYDDRGFTGLEYVLLLSYFGALAVLTFINARTSKARSSEARAR